MAEHSAHDYEDRGIDRNSFLEGTALAGAGVLGAEQLAFVKKDLAGLPSDTPLVLCPPPRRVAADTPAP